jgi:hypothetical protein
VKEEGGRIYSYSMILERQPGRERERELSERDI